MSEKSQPKYKEGQKIVLNFTISGLNPKKKLTIESVKPWNGFTFNQDENHDQWEYKIKEYPMIVSESDIILVCHKSEPVFNVGEKVNFSGLLCHFGNPTCQIITVWGSFPILYSEWVNYKWIHHFWDENWSNFTVTEEDIIKHYKELSSK